VKGTSRVTVWDRVRINHYIVKSYEEFLLRKKPRGRATNDQLRPFSFFKAHDMNEVEDAVPEWLIESTRNEIAVITELMNALQEQRVAPQRSQYAESE